MKKIGQAFDTTENCGPYHYDASPNMTGESTDEEAKWQFLEWSMVANAKSWNSARLTPILRQASAAPRAGVSTHISSIGPLI
ncbi:hypothetical protein HAX54_018503, partial [Datura stramonium]|nr:hypothetical protein [Datura stramonium]